MNTDPLTIVLVVIGLGAITALVAHKKGYHSMGWFLSGAAMFIVAFPIVLLIRKNQDGLDRRLIRNGEAKRCESCAELINPQAKVCRYCGAAA